MREKREGRARREGGVSLPPHSSRAPRASLAPKTPFPLPFKRLPRRLPLSGSSRNPLPHWWGGALCDDPNNGCEEMYLHSAELNVVAVTEDVNTFLLV